MNLRLLSLLRDPNDQSPLELHAFAAEPGFSSEPSAPTPSTSGSSGEGSSTSASSTATFSGSRVREGVLIQPHSGRWYPIEDGVPSLFVDALRVGAQREREQSFALRHRDSMHSLPISIEDGSENSKGQAQSPVSASDLARIDAERSARDEQAEDYDRMLAMRCLEWFERPAYRKAIEDALGAAPAERASLPLLEAGCGTGRLTGLFTSASDEVVAVDMSRDSIERNRVRHAGRTHGTVHFVHADLTHLPLRDSAFGAMAHCGVYEHIPSRELRLQFLAHAARTLAPGGTMLLSAYRYGGLTRLFEKEGEHAGNIPFFRFTRQELRDEVETAFDISSFRDNLGIYMSMLTATPRTP